MPKVTAINAQTGQPTGGPISTGRQIKAQTQQTPDPVEFAAQKAAQNATPPVQTQPPGQDNKVVDPKEATPLDPKFEALAKKETAFRQREREFQAKEAALEAKVQAAVDEALKQYKGRLKQAPLDVLTEEGLTYDQLVEQQLNAPNPETRAIQQKLQAIEDRQAKQAQDAETQAKSQREAAVKQIRFDVTDLIEADPNFETIKATGSSEDVVELITRTFDETGKLLSVDQAAQKVEEELLEEAIRIASIGKVKAKLKPELTPETLAQAKQPISQQQQSMTTLTNNMTSSRPMSARERAIKRFKGEAF